MISEIIKPTNNSINDCFQSLGYLLITMSNNKNLYSSWGSWVYKPCDFGPVI